MAGTVIVGLDGSAAAAAAVRWASDFARASNRTVRILHAWSAQALDGSVSPTLLRQEEAKAAREDAQRWLREALAGRDVQGISLEVFESRPGPLLTALAATEDDCVIVVGTHEHEGLGRVLHGSVSHYVLSHADCPVVAVPPPQPEPVRVYPDPSALHVDLPRMPRF
jgi:nucleotide-binding universal stress UspA family protein